MMKATGTVQRIGAEAEPMEFICWKDETSPEFFAKIGGNMKVVAVQAAHPVREGQHPFGKRDVLNIRPCLAMPPPIWDELVEDALTLGATDPEAARQEYRKNSLRLDVSDRAASSEYFERARKEGITGIDAEIERLETTAPEEVELNAGQREKHREEVERRHDAIADAFEQPFSEEIRRLNNESLADLGMTAKEWKAALNEAVERREAFQQERRARGGYTVFDLLDGPDDIQKAFRAFLQALQGEACRDQANESACEEFKRQWAEYHVPEYYALRFGAGARESKTAVQEKERQESLRLMEAREPLKSVLALTTDKLSKSKKYRDLWRAFLAFPLYFARVTIEEVQSWIEALRERRKRLEKLDYDAALQGAEGIRDDYLTAKWARENETDAAMLSANRESFWQSFSIFDPEELKNAGASPDANWFKELCQAVRYRVEFTGGVAAFAADWRARTLDGKEREQFRRVEIARIIGSDGEILEKPIVEFSNGFRCIRSPSLYAGKDMNLRHREGGRVERTKILEILYRHWSESPGMMVDWETIRRAVSSNYDAPLDAFVLQGKRAKFMDVQLRNEAFKAIVQVQVRDGIHECCLNTAFRYSVS